MGQINENDNNKNRKYKIVDRRIGDTYAKDSTARLKNKLYDAYVKFWRWAVDRLRGSDGIVCFVTNNSFVEDITFDGMRKHLRQDFTHIYHLDLGINIRKNPQLSGTTHNVFGIPRPSASPSPSGPASTARRSSSTTAYRTNGRRAGS